MATGDLHLLGTLYTGGIKRLMPTNPVNTGNVTTFVAGQTIEIRNTDVENTYKLRWREVNTESGKLLIADRNILRSISWDDLNVQGLVTGKEIEVDGKKYLLRLLTGGSNFRTGSDYYSGARPTDNEWDQIITNEANHTGIPKPTAADFTNSGANINGAHNQYWNWIQLLSWSQEIYVGASSNRVGRGHSSARVFDFHVSSNRDVTKCYRPVLEVLESAPEISVNINGTRRKAESIHVNVNGVWRKADSVHTNINGIWRKS